MLGNELTRRTFTKLLGGALASGAGIVTSSARNSGTGFACVASWSKENSGLHLFSIESDRWNQVDFVPVQSPAALASLPGGRGLVLANAVFDFHYRPSGYVESYVLDREVGRLSLAARRGLTLSATAPESLAISDCGKHLAVLAGAGSVLNVLPFSNSGTLGYPSLVRKQITSPSRVGRARSCGQLVFDAEGQLLWPNGHEGRVTRFALNEQELITTDLWQAPRSLQFDRLAIVAQSEWAFLAESTNGYIRTVRYDRPSCRFHETGPKHCILPADSPRDGRLRSLAIDSRRMRLFGVWSSSEQRRSGVTSWRIDDGGRLRQGSGCCLANTKFSALQVDHLTGLAYILDDRTGNIFCMNGSNGTMEQSTIAGVPDASTFLLL